MNYFTIGLLAEKVHVYAITFAPVAGRVVKSAAEKKEIISQLLQQGSLAQNSGFIACDFNSTLVVWGITLPDEETFNVDLPGLGTSGATRYLVKLERTHTLIKADLQNFLSGRDPLNVGPWLTALNIIARKDAMVGNVKLGADRFFPDGSGPAVKDIYIPSWTHGLNARRGIFTSIRPVSNNLVNNTHAICAAFVNEQSLVAYLKAFYSEFEKGNVRTPAEFGAFAPRVKMIARGLRVRFLYNPPTSGSTTKSQILSKPNPKSKIRRINDFGDSAAVEDFIHSQHGRITVQRYFERHVLAAPLLFPDLPVCNVGTRAKPIFVPSELLFIEKNQPFPGQLPEGVMEEMVKFAQRKPFDNVGLTEGAFGPGGMFDQAKLTVTPMRPTMLEINGRMLDIPALHYSGPAIPASRDMRGQLRTGKWNIQGKKFHLGGSMGFLGVVELGVPASMVLDTTYQALGTALTTYGMKGFHEVKKATARTASKADLDAALAVLTAKDFGKEHPHRFVLVMLPSRSADNYGALKWWADTQVGVHTVCVTKEKAKLLTGGGFQANLALKFNVKSGGHNHILPDADIKLLQDTMVVGADVTHPGVSGVRHCPSIAAVVASSDKSAVSFPGSVRLQRSKQEMIADLADMLIERLEVYYSNHGNKAPANILFYRDGVSESQFAAVKNDELVKIRNACTKFGKQKGFTIEYKPNITLIVCGKRHHTRFYPLQVKKLPPPQSNVSLARPLMTPSYPGCLLTFFLTARRRRR